MQIRIVSTLVSLFLLLSLSYSQTIPASQASQFIGKSKTVCGFVAGTKYSRKSKGQPTFLDIDASYPDQVLTVLIWDSDRGNFDTAPDVLYLKKSICVTGKIQLYKGKPEIVVSEPSQIEVRTRLQD